MKYRFASVLGLAALLLAGVGDSPLAGACSSSSETVAISTRHPDLPLTSYVKGELGLLHPTYARSHLVVAYLWLSGAPLDPGAQAALLELYQDRLAPIDQARVAPGLVSRPSPDSVARWQKERARILGAAAPTGGTGYTSPTYVAIESCLGDAFRMATETLQDRESRSGSTSPELVSWVRAQDMVFMNCANPKLRAIPQPLGAQASAPARADRAYQIATAYFYSNQWDEAERRFRAIGADRASPWGKLARYLAPRVRVRRATLEPPTPDAAELGRALADLDLLLRDPDMAPMYASLRKYRSFVRAKVEPAKLFTDLSSRIVAGGTGAELGQLVADYTLLIDADPSLLERAPEGDRLTTWIGVVQGVKSADIALRMYAAERSPLWLVAALMTAQNPADPRLAPLLTHALALPPDAPSFATARYHSHRLALARGGDPRALFDAVQRSRSALGPAAGISTRNAFTRLAARAAPSMDAFLREATIPPAGVSEEGYAVLFDASAPRALPPEIADLISSGLPLSSWKDASLSTALPSPVRAHVAATTWARALLVGDRRTASAVAPAAGQLNPALRPYIERVERGRADDERRLGLVHALLKFPTLGPSVEAWTAAPAAEQGISSSSGGYFWCAAPAQPGPPAAPAFATPADREAARRERLALSRLGAGATWLALESARLAGALPRDPRVPEVLHLAVRATRYGCKDAGTQGASKRAFTVLHRQYKDSTWAKATPYYY